MITGALLTGAVMSMETPLMDKTDEEVIDQNNCLKSIFCGKKTTPKD